MLNAAKNLTKNPLGIIGLFIVMVYSLACIVLGVGAEHLQPNEKLPLVWFIVLFPILILWAFYMLVTKHHKKLYAPSDFKNEELFLEPIADQRRNDRLDAEVENIISDQPKQDSGSPSDDLLIQDKHTLRSIYADAERLAFLELEQELKKPFQKYVKINVHGRMVEFDGVLVTPKEAHLFEVKYFRSPVIRRDMIESLMHQASAFIFDKLSDDKAVREDARLWLIAVVDFDNDKIEGFEKNLKNTLKNELYATELRVYSLSKLKEKFG